MALRFLVPVTWAVALAVPTSDVTTALATELEGQKIAVTVTAAPPPAAPREEDSPAPRLAPGRLGVLLLVAAASLLSISL